MKVPASLIKKLEAFLSTRGKSEGGGWGEVGATDTSLLRDILAGILNAKYEKDADGDLPINFILIDRTRYEPLHFMPVRYEHNAETLAEFDRLFEGHLLNLSMAMSRVENMTRMRQLRRSREDTAG